MKRILIALFTVFVCCETFAEPTDGFIPQLPPIYAHPEVVEYAIEKYVVAPCDPNKVAATYEQYMNPDDGTITMENLVQKICPAGCMDYTRCEEFTKALMIPYYDVCDSEKGKSNKKEHCINKVFFSNAVGTALNTSGTHVRLKEAIGLAQEYALVNDKQKVICVSNKAKSKKTNTIWCSGIDKEHFYEFKFNDIHETNDTYIADSLLASVCKIHNTEYRTSGVNIGTIASPSYSWPSSCLTGDRQICAGINKSLGRFSYKSEIGSVKNGTNANNSFSSCIISQIISNTSNLRTAFNIDNTVFQDVQYVAGEETDRQIKNYVRQQLQKQKIQFDERSFYCANSTNIIHGINPKEVQTCYVNGKPIDFLFKDLSEEKDFVKDAGLSKMACVQLGGKVDQKKCRGLDEQECNKLGNRLIARGEQGTKYLQEKGGCILNAAATEHAINLANEIVTGIAITLITEGAATIPVIVSIGTDLAFEAVQNWQDEIPYKDFKEFMAAAEECENITKEDILGDDSINDIRKYCMGNVLEKYSKLMNTEMKDLAPDVAEQLTQKMTHIKNIVGDESILYIDKSKISVGKQARNYASFALFGGLLIFNPEKWGSKSRTMLKEFSKLQFKASKKFATKLNKFINTGRLEAFPVERLETSEWKKLNSYLEPYGVELIDYKTENGNYKKLFFRETVTSKPSIFSKIYDNMPKEVLEQKLDWLAKYIEREGFSVRTAIEGLDKVGAFDIKRATKLANDLAAEITQRLAIRPDIIEKSKNWENLDRSTRKQLVLELQDIITTTRRPHLGNTVVDFNPEPGTSGSHGWNGSRHKFRYAIETNNFAEVLNTIIHENIHSFQVAYKSSIPDVFLDLADVVYTSDDYKLYRKTLEEQEAWFIGGSASKTVLKNFGLPYKTYVILGISVVGIEITDNLSD